MKPNMESDTKLEWILSGDFHGNRVDGKEEKKKNTAPLLSYNYFRILSILPISLNWILLIYYKNLLLFTWYLVSIEMGIEEQASC